MSVETTYIVEDDITSIPLNRSHAPGQEGTFQNEVCWEGVGQWVDYKIQQ